MTINAVLLAVVIMLGLSLARVHVVLSLLIGAIAGGLIAGLGLTDTLTAFQEGCEQLNKIYTNLPIYYYNR